jgi:isocitrate dehydrogenase
MPRETSMIEVPFISGDGIGEEIMNAARTVLDAAVLGDSGDARAIGWVELSAGEKAFAARGEWLPKETVARVRAAGVAIKGPLTTPVSGGFRSLNVALRQSLDLYASVRPVRHFEGVPSPVKEPAKMDLVIFRENTEDVYKGIEWRRGTAEALRLREFLRESMDVDLDEDAGIGLKPMSEHASKRLVRAAIRYAISHRRGVVTLVHKGNIMKFTEGAFRDWGYEVAREEFADSVLTEADRRPGVETRKVLVNDRIADNMFQQILTRPSEYSILATPNLNGDYLADACAAQVGGLGFAPGANVGDEVAVFEPVHGTAPKYAGKDVANPCALILSGAMMLEHLRMADAAAKIVRAVESTIKAGIVTHDVARGDNRLRPVGTQRFAEEVVRRL